MNETRNNRMKVYNYLMTCDGMVKLTTGAVLGGIVRHNYVLVHSAPPRVVKELLTKFQMISLVEEGLLIPLAELPELPEF